MRVLDANDNIPQLQLPGLSFTVPENTSAPVYVTTALATDDDIGTVTYSLLHVCGYTIPSISLSGSNADIEFSFIRSSDFFTINKTTGVVTTVTELDREGIPEHQLTILVIHVC